MFCYNKKGRRENDGNLNKAIIMLSSLVTHDFIQTGRYSD